MERINTSELDERVKYREETRDTNFCTVLALHCVTGVSMKDCNTYLGKFGRVFKKGMLINQIEEALSSTSKFFFKKGEYSNVNRITLKRFTEKHPEGRYYILVRGHALSVIDGVVYDYEDKPRRQVTRAWRCYTKEEVEALRKR
tara:strand:- start:649 stop:1080 length:432 start_codon:yes stop_codon:yes gene_type:complete